MRPHHVASLLLIASLATACGSSDEAEPETSPEPTESATFEISGRVLAPIDGTALIQQGLNAPAGEKFVPGTTPCQAADGAGISEGSQLVVKDADGTTVGTGDLAAGVLDASGEEPPISSPCSFDFAVTVPSDSDYYDLEVNGYASTFSIDELDYPINLNVTP